MSMFSICTAFTPQGHLDESIAQMANQEKVFTPEIGVIFRRFFQCVIQPHIIWAITEWKSEKHHNDAAQSLMKTRRDDRIASILFGPEPYFEVFCKADVDLAVGEFSDELGLIVVAHGLVNPESRDLLMKRRKERIGDQANKLRWLRVFHNSHNTDEFVAMLGFDDEVQFNKVREVGEFLLEEYLFTGIEEAFGMSCLAGYNQFICTPLRLTTP